MAVPRLAYTGLMFDGQLSITRNRATRGGATPTELDDLDEAWDSLTTRERRALSAANRRQWSTILDLNRASAPVVAPAPPVVPVAAPPVVPVAASEPVVPVAASEPVPAVIVVEPESEPAADVTEPMPERAGDLIDWIGANKLSAIHAQQAEVMRDKPRKTVLAHINRVLGVG